MGVFQEILELQIQVVEEEDLRMVLVNPHYQEDPVVPE
jgi:hypothetical protein